MKNIDEITVSLPISDLTREEQVSLFAVYAQEKDKNTGILPRTINIDEEKINFTFSALASVDVSEQVKTFADVVTNICEMTRQKEERKQNQNDKIIST